MGLPISLYNNRKKESVYVTSEKEVEERVDDPICVFLIFNLAVL
jgi:hypothetical protein